MKMERNTWDIFFDLHGVLIDPEHVVKNYEDFLINLVAPTGIFKSDILKVYRIAHVEWVSAFEDINTGIDDYANEPERFMEKIAVMDYKWQQTILSAFPNKSHRDMIAPFLSTEFFEYEAMANGDPNTIYPDVLPALNSINEISQVRALHVASSASSHHIRGAMSIVNSLSKHFKYFFGYDVVKIPKKSTSGLYFKVIQELAGSIPGRTIFIGDSFREARLSINRGMKFIMIDRFPAHEKQNVNSIPDITLINNLLDAIPLIRNIIESAE